MTDNIQHLNADTEIARHLLTIDRHLWQTLEGIKTTCGELFVNYVFKNPTLSDMCQEAVKEIEREQKGIKNAHKHKEDKPVFQWTV